MNSKTNEYEQIILEIKVSELYFLKGYDQGEIGKILGCSRSKVSRLLTKAIEDGVVEVKIKNPMEKAKKLEDKLKKQFSLKHIVVVSGNYNAANLHRKALGVAAAELADKIIKKNDIIGICSGRTIYGMINSLANLNKRLGIEVIPLLGGMGLVEKEYQINELCRKFAQYLGGTSKLLDAPLVVKSKKTYDLLLEEKGIKEVIESWERMTKVFVTIGSPASISPLTHNYSDLEKEEQQLLKTDAVGDICGRFIDKEGNECETSVSQRIIGITFDELKRVPVRVGIGGGKNKLGGIKGVLAKGIINALVTDEETAKSILEQQ